MPTDSSWLTNVRIGVDGAKKEEITQLLEKHKKCFLKQLPLQLPPERPVSHEITVEQGSAPPSRPPYRLSEPELDELRKQLESLMNHGFIEPSSSPYGAPVFFAKKSDGSLRLVCDWRPLNKITTKVQACLPNIDDLFDTVRGEQYFSKLDLMSGYHQVRIKQEDIPKTAINTPFGHYQFRDMGLGLTNAPATFTALMNSVFRPFIREPDPDKLKGKLHSKIISSDKFFPQNPKVKVRGRNSNGKTVKQTAEKTGTCEHL